MPYQSDAGNAHIALTGDSLITRPMSPFSEPRYLALVELLRGADASITNAEMLFHDYENAPTLAPGGTYMRASPKMLDELRWLGIDMLATANNHSYDYGENGVVTNLENIEASGLVYAGTGMNMSRAREPRYFDTPAGRVALLAVTSTGPTALYAGEQWRDGLGRPGANMLRYTSEYRVPKHVFDAFREMRDAFGLVKRLRAGNSGHRDHAWGMVQMPDTDSNFYMGSLQHTWQYPIPDGARIALGDDYGLTLTAEPGDVDSNLQRIRDARRMADIVVISVHSHEQGASKDDPAQFMIDFARSAIDAGADIVHGHGPHRDRGIEIYNGRPILYSLGHFVHQNATIERMALDNLRRQGLDRWEATPADFADTRWGREEEGELLGLAEEWTAWHDAVAVVEFADGLPKRIVLHPIELGYRRPRGQRGRPILAEPEVGAEIIEMFRRLSAPYGTAVRAEGEVGIIDIG
jgi:poly-gamma-glutamate synthesis protein (capsule biosynthesis protein)